MTLPYDYILAVFFMLSPGSAPQLVAPHEGKDACLKAANSPELIENLKAPQYAMRGAIPVCLKIELPVV